MKPFGADTLERMRMQGKRPAGFIVITECRDIARTARERGLYPITFTAGKAYDWRAVKGLRVQVVTKLRREAVASICLGIMESEPENFGVTYDDGKDFEQDWVIHAAR
jgi:hypothetical protein